MTETEILERIQKLITEGKVLIDLFVYKYAPENIILKHFGTKEKADSFIKETGNQSFSYKYQDWYTSSIKILEIFAPERKKEFIDQYESKTSRPDLMTYTLSDALRGVHNMSNSINPFCAFNRLKLQCEIMYSIKGVLENQFNKIRETIQKQIFDSEIDSAEYLFDSKLLRAAGAICGVIIEKSLLNLANVNSIHITKKKPHISDLNTVLYANKIIDSTINKLILYLADIRNKCDHYSPKNEPTDDEVRDLIDGTKKIISLCYSNN